MIEGNTDTENLPIKEEITQALISGLRSTYELHQSLGESGTKAQRLNQAGEMAMALDVQSEEKILEALRALNISMDVVSEEHGSFTIGENPSYLVSLDGLDGSGEYKAGRGQRMYGAMVSVSQHADPAYDDYIAAGVMIHSPVPQLVLAIKNQGVFTVDLDTLERRQMQRDNDKQFSEATAIDLDRNWPPYRQVLEENGQDFPNMGCAFFSAAARVALFVEGKVDLALEWTRKGNLEHPVMYALVKELGGVMTDSNGQSIGGEHFRTFRQDTHVPLVIAPNQEMANAASSRFNLPNLESQTFDRIG